MGTIQASETLGAIVRSATDAIITADPPGLTTHHIEVFPRQRIGQPLWPLDERAEFRPE